MSAANRKPLLALETSGRMLSAALWTERGLLVEQRVQEGARHGAALAPVAQELLKLAKLNIQDLGAVGVSLGPGSWTGLRIGLAAAKALCWGAGLTLVGVRSLEALALTATRTHPPAWDPHGEPERLLLTLRHAYSEGLYAALWRETAAAPERLMEECVVLPGDLPAAVAQAARGRTQTIAVCGDEICLAAIDIMGGGAGWVKLPGLDEIAAGALAELAWTQWGAGRGWSLPHEIHAAAPLYLRASDPELKLKRRSGNSA